MGSIPTSSYKHTEQKGQMKVKTETIEIIKVHDWDEAVTKTFGRPYSLQQQDGCMPRGFVHLQVPGDYCEDYMNDDVPEEINGTQMGVKFKTWMARDPKTPNLGDVYRCKLFWERNFYPCLATLATEMYDRGLIAEGEYKIEIDW